MSHRCIERSDTNGLCRYALSKLRPQDLEGRHVRIEARRLCIIIVGNVWYKLHTSFPSIQATDTSPSFNSLFSSAHHRRPRNAAPLTPRGGMPSQRVSEC